MLGYFMKVATALVGIAAAGPYSDIVYSLPGLNLT